MVTLKPNSLTSAEAKPYVIKALETFPDRSLRTADVLRLADKYAVDAGETYFMSSQMIRVATNRLVEQEPERYFRRYADANDLSFQPTNNVWVYSMTNPVPVYDKTVIHGLVREVAPKRPRKNPLLKDPGYPIGTQQRRYTGQSGSARGDLICQLVQELAKDADEAVDATQYKRTIESLNAQVKQLRQERDDAQRQLRQIVKAQQTIASILGQT